MNDQEKDRHLDELLDSALAQYSSAEPRPGLETRILAHVREAKAAAASPLRGWRWLWAAAMAAIAVLLFAFFVGRHSQVVAPPNNVARSPEPPAQVPTPQVDRRAPPIAPGRTTHGPKPRAPRAETVGLRLDQRPPVFPTPTPLSEQERLLLSYYARTPREEVIAQSHPDEPRAMSEDQTNVATPDLIFVPQKSSNTR